LPTSGKQANHEEVSKNSKSLAKMNTKYTSTQIVAITRDPHNTVEHGQLITKKYLGEHKVITAEQQFLGLILWFFLCI
jgi:hypothetical protein